MASVFHYSLVSKFPTSAGYRLTAAPVRLVFPSTRAELLDFVRHFDSVSDRLLATGQVSNAERLAHLAYEARRRAELAA